MAKSARLLFLLGIFCSGLLISAPAYAECGGTAQCIGVGPTETAALLAHHGGTDTFTLAFGNQPSGTTSASQTVFVAAVTGPAGSTAALGPLTISGATAAEFSITGGTCTNAGPVHGGSSCTITVAFNPASAGAKSATLNVPVDPPGCVGCITGRIVSLTGSGTAPLPTAGAATLSVQASTPTALDLASLISGTGTLAVRITTAPAHGTTSVSGTRVTYTPAAGYLGPDSFAYDVTGDSGTSAPAMVAVSVVPRPDPAADATVVGLLRAQTYTARRFARAQIANIHARMESLHTRSGPGRALTRFGSITQPSGSGLRASAPIGPDILRDGKQANEGTFLPASLTANLISAAKTRSLNLGASSDRGDAGSGATGIWVGGNVQFGSRDQTSDASGLRFSTDGVSAGIDRRFGDRLALGLSVGYGRDQTDIGTDGSRNRSKGSSVAVYGSYQPAASTYVDGLLGYGNLDLDSERFIATANDFARGSRKGEQWFGSLAAGYEFRDQSLLLSPYGRLDFARAQLKQYTESGAGLGALTYFEQRVPTLQLAMGLRVESAHESAFGWVVPRLRLEFRHDFKGERQATLAYADLPAGPIYAAPLSGEKRNSLLLGLGSDFILRGGLKFGVDYQVQRFSGVDRSQAVRLWLSQELDGKGFVPAVLSTRMYADPVRIEAGYNWDSNVNRASDSTDKLIDRTYSLNVGKGLVIPLGTHTRFVLTGFANADKFGRYARLDRVSAGGQGELQYRSSAEFDAPTFGLLGRFSFDEYAGQLRSGHRYSIGATVRQSLTDRIDLFGALASNARNAENAVFDGKDYSARFSLDYALWRSGTLYLGGEYRRGDLVSSLPQSLGYAGVAKAFAQDDAFGLAQLTAYRFEAKTTLWTLGYNWALGPRDALDLSVRRAESKTTNSPTGIYSGSNTYTANQFSAAWLMRF